MSWTPPDHMGADRIQGLDVYSQDGQRIGIIDEVLHPIDLSVGSPGRCLVIKADPSNGPNGSGNLYVPESAIDTIDEDRVTLEATRDAIADRSWTEPPEGYRLS